LVAYLFLFAAWSGGVWGQFFQGEGQDCGNKGEEAEEGGGHPETRGRVRRESETGNIWTAGNNTGGKDRGKIETFSRLTQETEIPFFFGRICIAINIFIYVK
jgi:hypothetical protein